MKRPKVPLVVVGILLGLIAMTAVQRSLLPVIESHNTSYGSPDISDSRANSVPNQALLQYVKIRDLLQSGEDVQAKSRLQNMQWQDLVIDSSKPSDTGIFSSFSPAALLMQVNQILLLRARREARAGDWAAMEQWLKCAHGISTQLLRSSSPTMTGLTLAQALDRETGRMEAEMYRNQHVTALAKQVEVREAAMQQMWHRKVFSLIQEVCSLHQVKEAEIYAQYKSSQEQQSALTALHSSWEPSDHALVVELTNLYRNERNRWMQIQTPSPRHEAV